MTNARILCSVIFVLLVFCVAESKGGEYCMKYRGYYHHTSVTYCSYGCCGSTYDQYCCGADVALIVGCVFAGILGISILVAIVCCFIKKKTHTGRVVQPAMPARPPGAHVTVVYTGTSGQNPGAPAVGVTHPMAPPAYKQFEHPPPAYNYNDPAYPPSTTSTAPYPPPQPPAPGFNMNDMNGQPPASTSTSAAPPSTNLPQ